MLIAVVVFKYRVQHFRTRKRYWHDGQTVERSFLFATAPYQFALFQLPVAPWHNHHRELHSLTAVDGEQRYAVVAATLYGVLVKSFVPFVKKLTYRRRIAADKFGEHILELAHIFVLSIESLKAEQAIEGIGEIHQRHSCKLFVAEKALWQKCVHVVSQ